MIDRTRQDRANAYRAEILARIAAAAAEARTRRLPRTDPHRPE
jgi:hypothetical protein